MDKFMQPPQPQPQPQQHQQKELDDCRKRKPSVQDDRRSTTLKKMRLYKVQEIANNNGSSNCTSSSLEQRKGSGWRNPLLRAGIDLLTSNAHENPLPKLPPQQSKVVNWRLACFMAREYLSRGTVLGKPWPLQESNRTPSENSAALPKLLEGDENVREKEKEKEGLYTILTTDFLRFDDVHIRGIVNPSQLAGWIGLR